MNHQDHPPLWDYSPPLIKIRALANQVEQLILERKYTEAKEAALNLAVEGRILSHVALSMQQDVDKMEAKRNALRERAQTV